MFPDNMDSVRGGIQRIEMWGWFFPMEPQWVKLKALSDHIDPWILKPEDQYHGEKDQPCQLMTAGTNVSGKLSLGVEVKLSFRVKN